MEPINPKAAEQAIRAAASGVRPLGGRRAATQRGGTFLGVILGVMVGLAVALGVAIYVAKVPVPFVNKGSSRTSGQDAAEAERNKDWDPNAPLRSRNGAKSSPAATGAVVPAPPVAPMPTPADAEKHPEAPSVPIPPPAEVKPAQRPDRPAADKAVAKPAEKAPEKSADKPSEKTAAKPAEKASAAPRAAPKPSSDPLGDLAAARSGTPAPTADPFTYFVQAGAFRTPEDAESQRARLSLLGIEARVTEREQSGRTVYRVRVGPFQNKDAADRTKERLDGNGFDSALVRVQR